MPIESYANFYSEDTYRVLPTLVKELEREEFIEALFGRIAGSRTHGISNFSSDNDICLFARRKEGYCNPSYENQIYKTGIINGDEVLFELGYITIERAWIDIETRLKSKYPGYPTCFHRSKREVEKYSQYKHMQMMFRDEYSFMMFHLLLMGDEIWFSEHMHDYDLIDLYKMEKTIDALDTYYVRAYGNYINEIEGKDKVLVRKYLYTLLQIWIMEWMLSEGTKPPTNFFELQRTISPIYMLNEVEKYVEINKKSSMHKTKLTDVASPMLNEYLKNELDSLAIKIAKYSQTELLTEVYLRTPIDKRPKVFDQLIEGWR